MHCAVPEHALAAGADDQTSYQPPLLKHLCHSVTIYSVTDHLVTKAFPALAGPLLLADMQQLRSCSMLALQAPSCAPLKH